MNAVGIFVFGVFVTLLVTAALGLLGWGIVTEWREGSIEDVGPSDSGGGAKEPSAAPTDPVESRAHDSDSAPSGSVPGGGAT